MPEFTDRLLVITQTENTSLNKNYANRLNQLWVCFIFKFGAMWHVRFGPATLYLVVLLHLLHHAHMYYV